MKQYQGEDHDRLYINMGYKDIEGNVLNIQNLIREIYYRLYMG